VCQLITDIAVAIAVATAANFDRGMTIGEDCFGAV
jgi:hypothetical protein